MAIRGYRASKQAAETAVAVDETNVETPANTDGQEVGAEGDAEPIPMNTVAQLVATVEKLLERAERDDVRDPDAMTLLREVLSSNQRALKSALAPENRLSPGISAYNPLGERDHPRPRLNRPCYFLGVPLDQPMLDREEIELLNQITQPIEIPSKHWRAAFLRDGGGGEALYLSVPFRGFDDLKTISGGIKGVVRTLLAEGQRPQNQDLLFERIAALEAKLADRESAPVETPAPS